MPRRQSATSRYPGLRELAAGGLLALALAGCQTVGQNGPETTGSINSVATLDPSNLTGDQALAAVQKWGSAYSRNEKDKLAALNYAAALRAAGETSQGVAVMRKAAIYHPTDRDVLAGFGKSLAADGQFSEALQTIRRAQRRDNPDWQLLAAEGAILDSGGDNNGARSLYRQALVLAPGEPQILNNLGMSYVLTNELDKAEDVLQQAAASPKATLRVRQNLALVQNLRGKPRAVASAKAAEQQEPFEDVSINPEPVVQQQDTWKEIEASG